MPPTDPTDDPDTLFVSSNPDAGPVTRFGVPNQVGGSIFIGAERDPSNPKAIVYHPEIIIVIPGNERRRYAREYSKALRSESLVEHTRVDWQRQQQQLHAASQAAPAPSLEQATPARASEAPPKKHG